MAGVKSACPLTPCLARMQRPRVHLSLAAGLLAVGLAAIVGIMVVNQTFGAPPADRLLQTVARIHRKGGRMVMLDEENPGLCAVRCAPARESLCLSVAAASYSQASRRNRAGLLALVRSRTATSCSS